MSSAPLGHFDPNAPTTVASDAPGTALSTVLSQQQGNREIVIEYASRSSTPSEQKFHSNAWEYIAAHWAIMQKFCQYLLGLKFRLVTEN